MRFFVTLLSGYRRCLVYPTKANPNPARLFNVDDYLDKLDRDSRAFAETMCDTQVRGEESAVTPTPCVILSALTWCM